MERSLETSRRMDNVVGGIGCHLMPTLQQVFEISQFYWVKIIPHCRFQSLRDYYVGIVTLMGPVLEMSTVLLALIILVLLSVHLFNGLTLQQPCIGPMIGQHSPISTEPNTRE